MRRTSSQISIPPEIEENWAIIALVLIFFLAAAIRMVPTKYGTIMDPDAFFMFRMARNVVEKGYFPSWDNLGWQPVGRPLHASMPLLPFSIAYTYMIVKNLGVETTLNSWTIVFPVIFGSLSIFPAYMIGKELRDDLTGILAAFLLATIPEYLNRTMGGVADKECLALTLMLFGFVFFFKMLKDTKMEKSLVKALGTGLFFGLVALTWGGFTYILLLLTAFYGVMVFLDITELVDIGDNVIIGSIVVSISMVIIGNTIANWGTSNPFILIHILSVLALVFYFALCRLMVRRAIVTRKNGIAIFLIAVALAGSFPFVGSSLGIIDFKVARKFIILLNPFETPETGMHVTVQEYAKPTVSDWFSRYSFYPFLALAGVIYCLSRRKLQDILLILWAGSGFYAGLSAIRSTMLFTPALCLLSAFATREFISILSRGRSIRSLVASKSKSARELARNELTMAKVGAPLAILTVLLIVSPSLILGLQLVRGRGPVLGQGWYDALTWMKRETPEDSIVASWWDYGHWITSVAERRCVTDGATTNFSTIQATARAYLSPEDVATDIFERYDVEYIMVPEHDFWLVGAFAQIVGNITDFPDGYYEINQETGSVSWQDLTPKAQNLTIYKLLFGRPDSELKRFELIHTSPASEQGDTTVRIYKFNQD